MLLTHEIFFSILAMRARTWHLHKWATSIDVFGSSCLLYGLHNGEFHRTHTVVWVGHRRTFTTHTNENCACQNFPFHFQWVCVNASDKERVSFTFYEIEEFDETNDLHSIRGRERWNVFTHTNTFGHIATLWPSYLWFEQSKYFNQIDKLLYVHLKLLCWSKVAYINEARPFIWVGFFAMFVYSFCLNSGELTLSEKHYGTVFKRVMHKSHSSKNFKWCWC